MATVYLTHLSRPDRHSADDFYLAMIVIAAVTALIFNSFESRTQRQSDDFAALLSRLDRIADALENRSETTNTPKPAPLADLSPASTAIAEGRWQAARAVLDNHPDHPDTPQLAAKLETARQDSTSNLLAQLEAAKEVADPGRVLELRDKLAEVMESEPLRTLDATLSKWFMPLIMKRLRTGSVGPDVPALAEQVAARFAATLEGASLRASLPTLRRSAGLCPRCSKAYRGIAEACPTCLAAPAITSAPPDSDEEAEEVEKLTRPVESPFLDLDGDA